MNAPIDKKALFEAGHAAYHANKELQDNPHPPESDEALEWEEGFRAAAEANDDTEALGEND